MSAPTPPPYGAQGLNALLPALAAGMGSRAADVAAGAEGLALGTGPVVVLLLVDGLGARALPQHASIAPTLVGLAAGAATLSAGFPSTTATSLTSLGTGLVPGRHGVVGYTFGLPSARPGGPPTLLHALRFDDDVDPLEVQPSPTLPERLTAAGVEVSHVGPPPHAGSGLTRAALRGARYLPAAAPGQRVAAAVAAAQDAVADDRPALVYVYYGELDSVGHDTGSSSLAWHAQLAHVDLLAAQLMAGLPAGADLVVTADHGMVDPQTRVDLDADPGYGDGVVLLGGEPRARHVYTRAGAAADVAAAWSALLGDRAWVARRDEAVAAGLFGAVADWVAPRLGDVVVVPGEGVALVAPGAEPAESALVGMHGGLTPDEVEVPLLIAPGQGRR